MISPQPISQLLNDSIQHMGAINKGSGRWILWRHLRYGDRHAGSDNSLGSDPNRQVFNTNSKIVRARYFNTQEGDHPHIFYGQFVPVEGDLLVTLRGAPTTKESAEQAVRNERFVGYFRVKSVADYRTGAADLVTCEIKTVADDTGRWAG